MEGYVYVISHCLLNPLVRVRGLGQPELCHRGPLIQLPCPEAIYMGLDRWAVTRNQLDLPEYRRFCRELMLSSLDAIEMLSRRYRIVVVGVAGSPSCGVFTTTTGYTGGRVRESEHEEIQGMGIFMEELRRAMAERGIDAEWHEARSRRIDRI
ncbi:MAG TPA: hypothetical protein PK659_08395 [Methanothrix sp.]|nr:hypothetical protein [Methanothrix sp.]HOK58971.1 hypothetical protein [Methanothrix sp.]HOL44254.1 hypothetical protein [Methanothrix sp.]HPO89232.1 hypothetical protein [Methanothrix sp.]